MDKCININNGKVKEIAEKLGVIPSIAAIKMEIWMNNNGGKIPTAEDLVSSTTNIPMPKSELITSLNNYLSNLGMDVKTVEDVKALTGYDAVATTDLLYKTVLIQSNPEEYAGRLAKEAAYVAYSFLGKKNKIRTDLTTSIENIDNYDAIFKQYKDRSPNLSNYKIKELIVIDFIADAIQNNFEAPKKSYQNRKADYWSIKGESKFEKQIRYQLSKIKQFLLKLIGANKLSKKELNSLFDDLASDILNSNFSKFSTGLNANEQLTNYENTIEKDEKAKEIVTTFQDMGIILTGSLALRKLGTLYRGKEEDLHDLDFSIVRELHDSFNPVGDLVEGYKKHPLVLKIKEAYPNFKVEQGFIGGHNEISLLCSIGDYKIDLFFVLDDNLDTTEKGFQDWQPIIKAKLQMGRAKDLKDFANYKLFNPVNEKLSQTVGLRHFNFIKNDLNVKPEEPAFNRSTLTREQQLAKNIFFNEIYNKNLNEFDIRRINDKLKRISDSIGDVNWNVRRSSEGNWYIAGYKNYQVTRKEYFSRYVKAYYNKTESVKTMPKDVAIKILDQFKERLGVDYQFVTPEQAKEILKNTSQGWNGETGFYFNGIAYAIDGENIDFDTPIHEMAHPFIRAVMKHNPALFNKIMTNLIESDEGAAIFDEVEGAGYKDDVMEEVAVRALTRAAQKNFDAKGSLFGKAVTRLINLLRSTLRNVFGIAPLKVKDLNVNTTLEELADIFSLKIGKIEDVSVKDNAEPGYNRSLQQNAVNKITSFQGKQTQFDTYYTVEGFETKLARPSTLSKKKIQGREQYKTEEEEKQQEKFMASGTLLHDIMSEIARREFPEENKHRAPMDITPDIASFYDVMEVFMAPIIKEAKDNGDVLLTEVFVGNLKTERGGTIDLLAVTPKGQYKIYDLKNRYRPDKNIVRRYNKIFEFSRQLEIYKQILEDGDEKLGIPKGKVISTVVLENKVSYNDVLSKITKINGITVVAPDFLKTSNEKVNALITKLHAQIEILIKKQPKNELEKDTYNKLLKSKMDLMQGLQLRLDTNAVIEHATTELAYIQLYLKDETNLDTTNVMAELSLYTDLTSYINVNELSPEMEELLKNVMWKAKNIKDSFLERQKELAIAAAEVVDYTGTSKLVENLFDPVKDINAFRKFTTGVAGVDNALVQVAWRTYINSIEKVAERMDTLKEKFLGVMSRFEKATGSRNFDMMLNKTKTALVGQYTSEFWDELKENRKKFDLKWAKENLNYDSQAYAEALADFESYQDRYKEIQMSRIEANLMSKGTKTEDLERAIYEIYWSNREKDKNQWLIENKNNPYKYFKVKDKWTDPKWKAIKEGQYKGTAVEEFYDFYTEYMKVANEIAPEKIRPGFIANFSQDFLDRASNLGIIGAVKGGWSELLNSLDLDYDEALFGRVDPITGEQMRELFIPGLSKSKQDKSVDLGKSFLMFMEGVFRYDELSQIESTIGNIKYQLRNVNQQRFDSQGNPIPQGVTTKVNPTKNVSEQLEYMIDSLIYGIKQKDEGSFKMKGNGFTEFVGVLKKGDTKTISYAKLIDKMIRYTGLRNLAFNMFAPPVNLLGGTANMYMHGAGGLDYTTGDLTKAIGLITAGKAHFHSADGLKMRLILDWLRLDKEKMDREIFKKVSNSKVSSIFEEYNGMTLMRESEAAMVESGAAAMILSGKHNVKFEDFDVIDGKLVTKTQFSSIAKAMFKQKIMTVNSKNIGAMNPDDIMLAKKYMLGRMLMQHRGWLPTLFFERFGQKQHNYVLERDVEGRYIVAVRAFKAIMAKGVAQGMESLTVEEQAAAKEAFAEATIILGTMLLLAALHAVDDDDKKEAWYKMTNKVSTRVLGELFFFADPTLQSQWQILLSPAASTSTAEDAGKLVRDIIKEGTADFQEDPDKVRKAAKPGKRFIKMIPYVSKTKSFLDDLYNVDEKDR